MTLPKHGAPPSGVDFAQIYRRLDEADRRLQAEASLVGARREEVLRARARAIADAREEREESKLEVLMFRAAGELMAVPILEVDHVVELKNVTRLPGLPAQVLGICATRSQIVPILDARSLLGLGGGMSDCAQGVVLHAPEGLFGLAVERIEGRVGIPVDALLPPPRGPFLHVTREGACVLDVARLRLTEAARSP